MTTEHSEELYREAIRESYLSKIKYDHHEYRALELKLKQSFRERDEAMEKAERYRLEANSLMLQRDEAREELKKLEGAYEDATNYYARMIELKEERDEARESLKHITEYGTEEINAAVELRQKLASALVERDEAQKELLEQARLLGMSSEREAKLISERDEARKKYDNLATEHMLAINKLCNERDEAKSISDELAIIASLCLGWHDHESNDTAIKIVAALKRWKKSKISNEQD